MSLDALRSYIAARLPILDKRMGPFSKDEVRRVFNAATRLKVMPNDLVDQSCTHFLDRLRELEEKGLLYIEALPAAMREVIKIEAERNGT